MLGSGDFDLIHSVIRYSSVGPKRLAVTPKEECMLSRHSKAMAILMLSIAVAVGGLVLTRHVIAVAGEADAERLNRSILDYIAQKNQIGRASCKGKSVDLGGRRIIKKKKRRKTETK